MKRELLAATAAAGIAAAAGCGLLVGLEDHELDPGAAAGGPDAGGSGGAGGAGGVVTLAEGQSLPHALALDDTAVYWVTEGAGDRAVWKVPKAGGDPQQLIALDDPTTENPASIPIGLALDLDNVYWTEDNGGGSCDPADAGYQQDRVRGVAKAGGDPFELWSDCPHFDPYGIATDGQYVFFSAQGVHDIVRIRKGTLDTASLTSNEYDPYAIAVDQSDVFWHLRTDWDGALRKAPKVGQGLSPVDLLRESSDMARRPNAIALDDTDIYWVDDGKVRARSKDEGGAGPRDLVDGTGVLAAMALDATHVYWANATEGTILRVPKAGGDVEELARDQNDPEAIAVDDSFIYWTNFGRGNVVKKAKP